MDNIDKKRESNASERITRSHVTNLNFASEWHASEQITRSHVNPEERFLVDIFSQITERLKHKYNYSDNEVFSLWNSENSVYVPAAIFSGKLSPAEALAKYLKENHGLGYREISELIGRDKRAVWANYKRAAKKMPWPFEINDSITVPVSIFNSDKSILEALVCYLKDVRKIKNRNIAKLLNKNPANIWTVHNRAKKKENKS